jgi:hypothetical protein
MKYLLISAVLTLAACSKEVPRVHIAAAVVNDKTDSLLLRPNAESLIGCLNLGSRKGAEVDFSYSEITDKILVPVTRLHLSGGTGATGSPFAREREILAFYGAIRDTFAALQISKDAVLPRSQCFRTIAARLHELAASNADIKVSIIYSDVQERSSLFDCYTKENKRLLLTQPEAVAKKLAALNLLPTSLRGVKVIFVFAPRNEEESYVAMIEVYKILLESKGAAVTVQASDNISF